MMEANKRLSKTKFTEVTVRTQNLTALQKAFGAKFCTRVGILGKTTHRTDSSGKKVKTLTNAGIGLVHEKGSYSRNIPRRSFLEATFTQHRAIILHQAKKRIWAWFAGGVWSVDRLKQAYQKLGLFAEGLVQEAFETGGFGYWQKLSKRTTDRKKSSAILIDTGQLRRSITSDVAKR